MSARTGVRDVASRADGADPVAVDEEHPVFDHAALGIGHRNDPGAGNSKHGVGYVSLEFHRQRRAIGRCLIATFAVVVFRREQRIDRGAVKGGAQRPVHRVVG